MANTVLIFDFDGTIADTYRYIVEISNRLADEFNYNLIDPDELNELKDRTSQEVIRYLKIPIMKIPSILAKAKKEFYKEIATIEPIKGVEDILKQLRGIGKQMGILSSNTSENILKFLKENNLDIFDFIHTTSKVWTKNTSLKNLIKKHNLQKDHVLYIGDEVRDIAAAKRLGVKVAAVTWGYNSSKTLKKHNPDFLVNSPQELLELCTDLK